MGYRIGTDIGGTCTDSVIMDDSGRVVIGKELTTYPDFSEGILDSLQSATENLDIGFDELLDNTSLFLHATTVGENTLFERTGAETGLITTEGFEETLHSTRGGYGRWSGLSQDAMKDVVKTAKPEPLIPMENIAGVTERAYRDRSIHPLDEEDVIETLDTFVDRGIEAVACCFVWSFQSPEHERSVKRIVEDWYPELDVTISSDISPTMGEYERTATTVLNSYLKPEIELYLDSLHEMLTRRGFAGTLLLMFAHGGLVPRNAAIEKPVGLIESGPVAGLLGSRFTGEQIDANHIISVDMGGTTFKVGVIREDLIEYADEPMVGRHHYQFPKRDIHSAALAGGSIVSIDEETGVPSIGPESAGSDPGPVCYGRGGEKPTITDVNLIRGYFDPEFFLGGGHDMAAEKARRIFEAEIAEPLGKDPETAAADIYKLANTMIADLIREVTVEKGIDPRKFALTSLGGAAGMHVAAFARELDIPEVIIPKTASVHSAFGLLSTDVIHLSTNQFALQPPFEVEEINEAFERIEGTARDKLRDAGFDSDEISLHRSISMRFHRQVHEVMTPVEADGPLDAADLQATLDRFERMYEQRYGEGSVFKQGVIEMVEFHVRGVGALDHPAIQGEAPRGADPAESRIHRKEIHFEARDGFVETPIYDFREMDPGWAIDGPGVILTPVTTIVVNPGDRATMDRFQNIRIRIGGDR